MRVGAGADSTELLVVVCCGAAVSEGKWGERGRQRIALEDGGA